MVLGGREQGKSFLHPGPSIQIRLLHRVPDVVARLKSDNPPGFVHYSIASVSHFPRSSILMSQSLRIWIHPYLGSRMDQAVVLFSVVSPSFAGIAFFFFVVILVEPVFVNFVQLGLSVHEFRPFRLSAGWISSHGCMLGIS